jgi:uncharacterized protein YndB with AHSA1/START domain/DNA-binding transcriptional ArsR family regulator
MDAVFKALADTSRRQLLDRLNRRNGQSLQELCEGLDMARQSVTKHLAVLEAAGVVTTTRRGREKLHFLDAAPINDIAERWMTRYDRERAGALTDLKRALEETTMQATEFVCTTYIATTPGRLWQALTDPAFTRRYWAAEQNSDWQVGSPILWKEADPEPRDLGQVVLEAEPHRRLSYTWHHPQHYHAKVLGWSETASRRAARCWTPSAEAGRTSSPTSRRSWRPATPWPPGPRTPAGRRSGALPGPAGPPHPSGGGAAGRPPGASPRARPRGASP